MTTRFVAAAAVLVLLAGGCRSKSASTASAPSSELASTPTKQYFANTDLATQVKSTIDHLARSMTPRPRYLAVGETPNSIILYGSVCTYEQRSQLEAAARATTDVKHIDSQLLVGMPQVN